MAVARSGSGEHSLDRDDNVTFVESAKGRMRLARFARELDTSESWQTTVARAGL